MQDSEPFFPPFSGAMTDRVLNLLINANPITFLIRALFLTQPNLAGAFGSAADAIIQSQRLPSNLFDPGRIPDKPLITGDRVFSPFRQWPDSERFGGYILLINGNYAIVQWDFIPIGPLTYDPLTWLEPEM